MSAQPIFYQDMIVAARTELSDAGINGEKVDELASRIAVKFCNDHGEKTYRVPVLKSMTKAQRDRAIVLDSETMTPRQIAKKYELTVDTVYVLLRANRAG